VCRLRPDAKKSSRRDHSRDLKVAYREAEVCFDQHRDSSFIFRLSHHSFIRHARTFPSPHSADPNAMPCLCSADFIGYTASARPIKLHAGREGVNLLSDPGTMKRGPNCWSGPATTMKNFAVEGSKLRVFGFLWLSASHNGVLMRS
jgi:hypothetical protein